jgi:hypothetical protein
MADGKAADRPCVRTTEGLDLEALIVDLIRLLPDGEGDLQADSLTDGAARKLHALPGAERHERQALRVRMHRDAPGLG